jgi:hypothetical protein
MEKKQYSSGGVSDLLSQCAVELREICVLCAAPSKGFTYRQLQSTAALYYSNITRLQELR